MMCFKSRLREFVSSLVGLVGHLLVVWVVRFLRVDLVTIIYVVTYCSMIRGNLGYLSYLGLVYVCCLSRLKLN